MDGNIDELGKYLESRDASKLCPRLSAHEYLKQLSFNDKDDGKESLFKLPVPWVRNEVPESTDQRQSTLKDRCSCECKKVTYSNQPVYRPTTLLIPAQIAPPKPPQHEVRVVPDTEACPPQRVVVQQQAINNNACTCPKVPLPLIDPVPVRPVYTKCDCRLIQRPNGSRQKNQTKLLNECKGSIEKPTHEMSDLKIYGKSSENVASSEDADDEEDEEDSNESISFRRSQTTSISCKSTDTILHDDDGDSRICGCVRIQSCRAYKPVLDADGIPDGTFIGRDCIWTTCGKCDQGYVRAKVVDSEESIEFGDAITTTDGPNFHYSSSESEAGFTSSTEASLHYPNPVNMNIDLQDFTAAQKKTKFLDENFVEQNAIEEPPAEENADSKSELHLALESVLGADNKNLQSMLDILEMDREALNCPPTINIRACGLYPGYGKFGHKACIIPNKRIPPRMGWMYRSCLGAGKYAPNLGWKPAAIRRQVVDVMNKARIKEVKKQPFIQSHPSPGLEKSKKKKKRRKRKADKTCTLAFGKHMSKKKRAAKLRAASSGISIADLKKRKQCYEKRKMGIIDAEEVEYAAEDEPDFQIGVQADLYVKRKTKEKKKTGLDSLELNRDVLKAILAFPFEGDVDTFLEMYSEAADEIERKKIELQEKQKEKCEPRKKKRRSKEDDEDDSDEAEANEGDSKGRAKRKSEYGRGYNEKGETVDENGIAMEESEDTSMASECSSHQPTLTLRKTRGIYTVSMHPPGRKKGKDVSFTFNRKALDQEPPPTDNDTTSITEDSMEFHYTSGIDYYRKVQCDKRRIAQTNVKTILYQPHRKKLQKEREEREMEKLSQLESETDLVSDGEFDSEY